MAKTKTKSVPFLPVSVKQLQSASAKLIGRASTVEKFITKMDEAKAKGYSIQPSKLEITGFDNTLKTLQGNWNLDMLMKPDLINIAQLTDEKMRERLVSHEVAVQKQKLTKVLKDVGNPVDAMEDSKRLDIALEIYQKCIENIFGEVKERVDRVYPDKAALDAAYEKVFGGPLSFTESALSTEGKSEIEVIEAVADNLNTGT